MSCPDKNEDFDKISAVSDDSSLTHEEEIFENTIIPVSNSKPKNVKTKAKKYPVKDHRCTLNVSLRYGKKTRLYIAKSEIRKKINRKTQKSFGVFTKSPSENLKKGKRGHIGGKAKEKPIESSEKEASAKCDSDEETDVSYYSRISLGYFQKFQDKSGASTSYQREDNDRNYFAGIKDMSDISPDDEELLELHRWGRTALIPYNNERDEKLNGL